MGSSRKANLYYALSLQVQRLMRKRTDPFVYVAIGDSTVEGIGASNLSRAYASLIHTEVSLNFKNAIHHNFGKSGARAGDVLSGQLEQTIVANPDLITLSIGANDILRHTRLPVFRKKLAHLIESLQVRTHALIVITNVPNFSLLRVVPMPLKPIAKYQIQRFNAAILTIATTYNVVHIDAFRHTAMFARQFPEELVCKDGFHPSDFSYALWANTILITLQDKLATLQAERRHHMPKPTFL